MCLGYRARSGRQTSYPMRWPVASHSTCSVSWMTLTARLFISRRIPRSHRSASAHSAIKLGVMSLRISIVTISFNQAKFLEDAIRSVINQNYGDIEYIVVDPGSSDGSRDIIDGYRSKISKVIFDPDEGPADGLNKGFAAATGAIYGFLNSDDLLEPGSLARVALTFDALPCADVISGHSWIINHAGEVKRRFYSDRYSIWMAARGASILSQASTFFRAEAYRKTGGFNVENRIAWDGELFADMALSGARFSCVNEIWSKFRIHEEGITGSGKLHKLHEEYCDYLFNKITGHDPNLIDRVTMIFAKYLRKLANPLDTKERLLYGSIYRRSEK
jgi:glycosyltransferase involved in cell wall biosynthesis